MQYCMFTQKEIIKQKTLVNIELSKSARADRPELHEPPSVIALVIG